MALPCGVPARGCIMSDSVLFIFMFAVRPSRKLAVHRTIFFGSLSVVILYSSPLIQQRSNADWMSRKAANVVLPVLKLCWNCEMTCSVWSWMVMSLRYPA